MAGAAVGEPKPTNRDWSDCDPTFAEEAEAATVAVRTRGGPGADGFSDAEELIKRYRHSPLAYTILAEWHRVNGGLEGERENLDRAAELAPRCPRTAFMLAAVLTRMGLWNDVVEVCDRSLRVREPTDPALHFPYQRNRVVTKSPEHRIASTREGIRQLRLAAVKRMRTAIPPKPSLSEPDWPPVSAELHVARDLWRGMSEEERQAFLKVSFEDMESYCRSRGLLQLTRVLSAAAEKKFLGSRDKSCFLWICPVCPIIIPLHEGFYHDKTQFMIHMETFHIKIEDEEYEKMRSIMPETIPDHEMELLKSWRWEPQPIDGDDLAERAKILSDVKRIVSKLIDREAISLNLLYAIYTFIMTWVRPARPYVVSMCGCCGIGQLSSERLKELYKLLEPLTYILTGYEHQTRHNGEQESQQDSLVATFLVNETGTYMCFDCGKIASTKADGSNQLIDEMFDSLFCESLLMYPSESWDDMTQRCFGSGPDIVKKMREALDKLKTNCSSCEILKGKFPDFFLPDAILETVFDAKSYFHSGIDCAQVEMLLIDAEVDYLRKRLLETCRMNIVLTVLPVAKACLWDKWNNSPPQKALRLCPLNDLELEAPLDMILRSLWHLRRFHDTLQKIPCKFPHVKDGESQIGMELREIFDSWDDDEECKPCDPCGSTRFADFSNSLVYKKDGNRRTATEIVKIIFRRLHSSQTPLHFEFKCESLEQQTVVEPSLHSCICLMHDLFGLHICENKCNCMNEVPRKYKHTTFFHNIDLGAVGNAKFESLSELLKVMESRIESCGHKVPQYSLLYPPRLFMTVFQWKNDKVCHINMHEVLLNLTTELDISHFYGGLPPGSNYTLVSAVCCNDRGQYICFARNNNRWLTYGNNAVMSAESWQESTDRYRQDNLRPEVVFFEHAIRSSR